MKSTLSLLLALGAAPAALAHTAFSDIYINGVQQGDGVAMRMRRDPGKVSFPLEDLSSKDMACNVDGDKSVSRVASVPDGATLTFEFRSWTSDPTKPRLDPGHKGPCAVYLKKVDSAIDDPGYGDGWFKLFDDGYDASTKQWCTDKLIDNKGLFSVALPKGLKGGYYLARPEILALHNAANGDPQFYAGCAQVFVESTGDLVPETTVSIPGYVKAGEDSVSFNIYTRDNAEYKVPGPKVAKLSSSSSAAGTNSQAQTKQTEGLRPSDCILENDNWCGKETSDYSDEKGCWASADECWKQLDVCYHTSLPTGNAGCKIWGDKCQAHGDSCKAKNFNGPANKGKDLTPPKKTIDVGLVFPAQSGGVDSSPKPSAQAPAASSAAVSAPAASATPAQQSQAPPKASYTGGYEAAAPSAAAANAGKPTMTVTLHASAAAPAPTEAVCPPNYECVTEVVKVTKTKVEYKTVYANDRRRSMHERRNRY